MILHGELQPGQRVREVELASNLGVSRTPVREALPMLAQEGILIQLDTRGFVVREFTRKEIMDAIDVRGVLEGLAARTLAEQGPSRRLMQSLHDCLHEGDEIFAKRHLIESDEDRYGDMNKQFHALIVQGAGSKVIAEALERNPILVTALNPVIGYEKGAAIAKKAYGEGRPIREVAKEMTDLSGDQLAKLLDPAELTRGGIKGGGGGGG